MSCSLFFSHSKQSISRISLGLLSSFTCGKLMVVLPSKNSSTSYSCLANRLQLLLLPQVILSIYCCSYLKFFLLMEINFCCHFSETCDVHFWYFTRLWANADSSRRAVYRPAYITHHHQQQQQGIRHLKSSSCLIIIGLSIVSKVDPRSSTLWNIFKHYLANKIAFLNKCVAH